MCGLETILNEPLVNPNFDSSDSALHSRQKVLWPLAQYHKQWETPSWATNCETCLISDIAPKQHGQAWREALVRSALIACIFLTRPVCFAILLRFDKVWVLLKRSQTFAGDSNPSRGYLSHCKTATKLVDKFDTLTAGSSEPSVANRSQIIRFVVPVACLGTHCVSRSIKLLFCVDQP